VRASPLLLGVVLLVTAIAKLTTGAPPGQFLPGYVSYAVGASELVLAMMLFSMRRRLVLWAASAAIILAIGGIVVSLVVAKPCGCMGKWATLTQLQARMLSSCVGIMAIGSVLYVTSHSQSERSGEYRASAR
jgi:hypothetical protein